jgi:hypothetical protein
LADPAPPEDPVDRDAELRRIEERITVISNWLIQGRCGDDAECIEAKSLELRTLQERRARLHG